MSNQSEFITIIRPSFMRFCDDACRAAAFNHLLFRIAGKSKDQPKEEIQAGTILWYAKTEQITGEMSNAWGVCKVRKEVNALIDMGIIGRRSNPDWGADRTKHFCFGEKQCRKFLQLCQKHEICVMHLGLSPEVTHLIYSSNANDTSIKCICLIHQMEMIEVSDANDKSITAITIDSPTKDNNKDRDNGDTASDAATPAPENVIPEKTLDAFRKKKTDPKIPIAPDVTAVSYSNQTTHPDNLPVASGSEAWLADVPAITALESEEDDALEWQNTPTLPRLEVFKPTSQDVSDGYTNQAQGENNHAVSVSSHVSSNMAGDSLDKQSAEQAIGDAHADESPASPVAGCDSVADGSVPAVAQGGNDAAFHGDNHAITPGSDTRTGSNQDSALSATPGGNADSAYGTDAGDQRGNGTARTVARLGGDTHGQLEQTSLDPLVTNTGTAQADGSPAISSAGQRAVPGEKPFSLQPDMPNVALSAKEQERLIEKRKGEIRAIIKRETKMRLTKTWWELAQNDAGLNRMIADEMGDEDISTAAKAMMESADSWLRDNFSGSLFYARMPGLLNKSKTPQNGHAGANGKAQSPPVVTGYHNKSEELRRDREKYAQGGRR